MARVDVRTAILTAVPSLLLAGAAWLQADAAKKSEAQTYSNAAETIGSQSDEIMMLESRIRRLERYCVVGGGDTIFRDNEINTGGGTGVIIGDKLPGGPRDPAIFRNQ